MGMGVSITILLFAMFIVAGAMFFDALYPRTEEFDTTGEIWIIDNDNHVRAQFEGKLSIRLEKNDTAYIEYILPEEAPERPEREYRRVPEKELMNFDLMRGW